MPQLIFTGRARQVLMGGPGAFRSRHCSHSVAGVGPLAAECLNSHKVDDAPTGRSSPFGKLLEHGGKMAWVGASLGATTFLHFLATELDLPCLAGSLCCVKEDGQVRTLLVPKHLPGHRDFYGAKREDSKAYRRLVSMGLSIGRANVGLGAVKVIEARPMYELGMRALGEDPNLFLCDSKECSFCGGHRKG